MQIMSTSGSQHASLTRLYIVPFSYFRSHSLVVRHTCACTSSLTSLPWSESSNSLTRERTCFFFTFKLAHFDLEWFNFLQWVHCLPHAKQANLFCSCSQPQNWQSDTISIALFDTLSVVLFIGADLLPLNQ